MCMGVAEQAGSVGTVPKGPFTTWKEAGLPTHEHCADIQVGPHPSA
jgi:hypothetical protein